jgi:tyrosine ammonia-lyase
MIIWKHSSVVSPEQIDAIAAGERLVLDDSARQAMSASHNLLAELIEKKRLIYGVTTGFGPLACHYVSGAEAADLQRNCIYHLASGVGEPFPTRTVRAIMATRLANLIRGHSAVRPETADLLVAMLNQGIIPIVPCMGTVGASGDLTPLAHVVLAMMGEGQVEYQGMRMP